jgi:hypothetical protein
MESRPRSGGWAEGSWGGGVQSGKGVGLDEEEVFRTEATARKKSQRQERAVTGKV